MNGSSVVSLNALLWRTGVKRIVEGTKRFSGDGRALRKEVGVDGRRFAGDISKACIIRWIYVWWWNEAPC